MVSMIIIAAVTAAAAYLIGSVNSAILLSKAAGKDIREIGSGNAGATNMMREYGVMMGLLTLILDVIKGALIIFLTFVINYYFLSKMDFGPEPVLLGFNSDYILRAIPYLAGFFAILGHCFPVFFGFKGGKGVAPALGIVLIIDWQAAATLLVVALLAIIFTRYVSVGSIVGAATFVVLTFARQLYNRDFNILILAIAFLIALFIVLRHHDNIKRLKRGEENKLFARKKKEPKKPKEAAEPVRDASQASVPEGADENGDIDIVE